VWFWTARAAEAAGVPSRAVEAYRTYLERAPKRAEHRAAAEASLAALAPSEPPPPDAND
jgi:predicted TPR repeat methyltransferase